MNVTRRSAGRSGPAALGFCSLLFALLLLQACGGGESDGGGAGGTIVVGMRSDLGGLNPVTYTDQYTYELLNYALFTPIVQYDDKLQVRPYLAESWELTGDTGVVFKLRRDVRWHDGKPVTAEDVKFTYDRAKDPASASLVGSAFIAEVDRAEVTDSFTVRFHFARPHAQALEDFWWAPLPKHLLENVGPAELRNAPFNRQPVGSGPFKLVEWQANQRMVLEPNPAFPEALDREGERQVQFNIIFPRERMYRLWVQFQNKGVVNTVAFNVPVVKLR